MQLYTEIHTDTYTHKIVPDFVVVFRLESLACLISLTVERIVFLCFLTDEL